MLIFLGDFHDRILKINYQQISVLKLLIPYLKLLFIVLFYFDVILISKDKKNCSIPVKGPKEYNINQKL